MPVPYAEVIGDPIAQSKSPAIHNFWLGQLGIAGEYRATLLQGDALAEYFAARRADHDWRGCNVTMPHKLAVLPLLDHIDPPAARIGAVNTVVRGGDGALTGYNTDIAGVAEPLRRMAAPGAHACIIGAGGAARAAVAGVERAGVSSITLYNRSVEPARMLAAMAAVPATALPLSALDGRAQIIINATSMGMLGNPPVLIDLTRFAADTIVFDMVYAPLETPLLAEARRLGLRTIDGLAMLIGQAAAAFTHFFGALPVRDDGDTALRRILVG